MDSGGFSICENYAHQNETSFYSPVQIQPKVDVEWEIKILSLGGLLHVKKMSVKERGIWRFLFWAFVFGFLTIKSLGYVLPEV